MTRNFSPGHTTPCDSLTRICNGREKKEVIPRQTQMTRSPQSILSIESQDTAAQESEQNTESDGTNILQKTIRVSPPRSCLLVSPEATASVKREAEEAIPIWNYRQKCQRVPVDRGMASISEMEVHRPVYFCRVQHQDHGACSFRRGPNFKIQNTRNAVMISS